jgi:predicted DNA-binding protein
MKERLETISEETGLGHAEIIRRGLLNQLNTLEEAEHK